MSTLKEEVHWKGYVIGYVIQLKRLEQIHILDCKKQAIEALVAQ